MTRKYLKLALVGAISVQAWAQAPNPTQSTDPVSLGDVPVFRVTATARATRAINFNHRDGSTRMNLIGTALMPKAKGDVKVDSKTGATKIDVSFNDLSPAQSHGEAFLTYVMWAVTPDGRPENLGEVMISGDDARLQAATNLQTFGLIVTAEPYFAVTQPSDIVVMEGEIKEGATEGTFSIINAKYELMDHGWYDAVLPPADEALKRVNKDAPLDLKEARHALAIARSIGAESYAMDTVTRAQTDLINAEGIWQSRRDRKRVETLARNVTQLAEDARLVTLRQREAERLNAERAAAAQRVADAASEAERQANLRALAETEKRQAEARERQASEATAREAQLRIWAEGRQAELAEARAEAERALAETQAALNQTVAAKNAAEAEAARQRNAAQQAARDAEQARLNAEAEVARQRSAAEQAARDAEASRAAAEQAALAKANTESNLAALRAANETAEARAREAEQARLAAEAERAELRIRIREQLNKVLETRESARGLIVNLSDVLFDTDKYNLKPGAREKLAKVAGILQAYPDLTVEVEGHTDSVGSDQYNQTLSEKRAESVKTYLVEQGVPSGTVTAEGLGESNPVATNDTAAGRQQNRRVELVVAGESIKVATR